MGARSPTLPLLQPGARISRLKRGVAMRPAVPSSHGTKRLLLVRVLFRIDDLASATLGQIDRYFRPDLFDEDVAPELERMAEAHYDIDDRFIKAPAKHLLEQLRSA